MAGPTLRTDIVDVYVFRRRLAAIEFLQLHRAGGALSGTWQPVMGHVRDGNTAVATALRELEEETGYAPGRSLTSLWQLEAVNTYFLASRDCVMLSPCFAALVEPDADPRLNNEHDDFRWVARDHVDRFFIWPGQRTAIEQIVRDLVPAVMGAPSAVSNLLRIELPSR